MRLDSAFDLKRQLLDELVTPFVAASRQPFAVGARPLDSVPAIQRSVALGIAPGHGEFRLAIRVQRPALMNSAVVRRMVDEAEGEADIRLIGRVDKRGKRARKAAKRTPRRARPRRGTRAPARAREIGALPWFQQRARPLLIGGSLAHADVTAGSIGAFVSHQGRVCVLSNNHVIANEDRATPGDAILQPGPLDGGRSPADRVGALLTVVPLDRDGANVVDAALAELAVDHDPSRLRELIGGEDRVLAGLGPDPVDEGRTVFKIGRATGSTAGRITAFDLDNVIVNFDSGNLRFDNQIEIESAGGGVFSDGGDSGALVVDEAMAAIALVFAGTDSGASNGLGFTYANPIHRVLDELEATLLF